MPYFFGGLVLLNALSLGYYLFVKAPAPTDSVAKVQATLERPIAFTNSAQHIPPPIGKKD